jgi:CDP-6-deoxy-D-xylo-4-hexulose-3-dehydrase
MEGSDEIMNSTLFLGTFPGLTEAMLDKEVSVIRDFCSANG